MQNDLLYINIAQWSHTVLFVYGHHFCCYVSCRSTAGFVFEPCIPHYTTLASHAYHTMLWAAIQHRQKNSK